MREREITSAQHAAVRTALRVAGPVTSLVGLIFLAVGLLSFFSAFGSDQMPRLFWCCFVGMPLLFAGVVMCQFGYLGAIQRYVAGESAPVTKDVANYIGEGIAPGVKAVAKAMTEGIAEGSAESRQKP